VDESPWTHLTGGYGTIYGRGHSQISVFEAATNFLEVFNMSATKARQGGCVQLKQSDMPLDLKITTLAKGGFSIATVEETQYLVMEPCAKVQEEMK
jgi:hypothetical protein